MTTTSSTAATLQRRLRSSGIAASEISLFGRYHTRDHSTILAQLLSFCDSNAAFQLPDASQASVPARSNRDGAIIASGPLHHHALRSILVERPEWAASLRAASQDLLRDEGPGLAVCFGPERCVPPSLVRDLGSRAVHLADLADPDLALSGRGERGERRRRHFAETDVAVVGMACKAAGADDLETFWEVLGSGQSQHSEVPPERFGFETAFRAADAKRRWFGNFVDGHDAFDHKFFRASARESATTDPQQRLMLQVAYQAVEQSGYFQRTRQAGDRRVGCYVGICGTDYEHNIACQPANAFCATGNLEGFAAGKISHHFGWTGPAMVVDTACSSSAVAIHQACRSIIAGECTAALAGGSHIMTSPLRFQNLAGASFLSLTGQCKPFDSRADGYCRGEGVAAVFLKKASVAVADGDMILGVIAATAVQQNRSCTPIFVPNSPSLSDLFREVLQRARVRPEQVSVVEAHGTGTAVGDPVEYRSVREVMGGPARRAAGELVLGSVKGSIGHTEPVSGVLSLVKVLLMMQRRMVPPQASFEVLNPAIEASPADRIVIPTKARHWEGDDAGFRAALINNYGASGSNASMVVTQPPAWVAQAATDLTGALPGLGSKHPFWLCGNDKATLSRYAGVLRQFLARHRSQGDTYSSDDLSPANVAFNLARQSNRLLGHGVIFSVRSADELERKLAAVEQGDGTDSVVAAGATARPVVLCFGGQVSTFVGLDREVYSRVAVLRHHLDTVDAVVRGLGAASIYPGIFEREPQADPVALQTMLFALQFACARSWIDAGLEPVAVVGHSFGELTALCVSQTVSLEDVVRAIVGRAKLVRERWGADRGAMVAVEGDRAEVERLLAEAAREVRDEVQPATIACYNGPRSFTLAGPTAAIEVVSRVLERRPAAYPGLRSKLLRVTHAFHCGLVDPLVPGLEECGGGLTFREPKIPMERATEEEAEGKPSGGFLAAHMRLPVFFNHALQRISNKHPGCVFLEAGSGSTVAAMAGRALGNNDKQNIFQGLDVTNVPGSGWNNLVDATTNLWKAGVRVHFWAHQGRQTSQQNPSLPLVLLPPYQFEKSRHWIELKTPPKPGNLPTVCSSCSQAAKAEKKEKKEEEEQLVRFIGYRNKDGSDRGPVAQFVIDTAGKEYGRLVSGHVFASTAPICPATVQLDFVIEALRGLRPELARLEPRLQGVQCQSPVCVDPARTLWIELEEAAGAAATAAEPGRWEFRVFSTDGAGTATVHTTGAVVLWRAGDATAALEIARLERLVGGLARCEAVLRGGEEGDEVLQSRSIYKIFADVVDYTGDYRGVQRLVGREDVSAGFVSRRAAATTWFDACLADCFCQVAGIWANCMTDQAAADMFVCNGIEQWVRNPAASAEGGRPKAFRVLARHHTVSAKAFLSDVFAFDADTGALVDVVTGISYVRVARASMSKLLVRMSALSAVVGGQGVGPVAAAAIPAPLAAAATTATTTTATSTNPVSATAPPPPPTPPSPSLTPVASSKSSAKPPGPPNVAPKVKAILAELTGIEPDEIQADSQLANLGVDSLLGMEMAHEIESAFGICLPESELLEITDVPGLVRCVQNAVARKGGDSTAGDIADGEKEEEQDEVDDSSSSDAGTPSQSCSSGVQTGLSTPLPVSEIGAGGKIDSRPAGIGCGNNSSDDLYLSVDAVMDAFDQTKRMTDARIVEYGQDRYADEANPLQTRLCAALILEAFEDLGCPLGPPRTAGQEPPKLVRVPHGREHSRLVDALYAMLERDEAGHLVAVDGCSITRTSEPLPTEPSTALFQQLQTQFPDQATANELILYAGSRLADVLRGRTDGIKLIFGCAEGRATVSRFYADWPLHRLLYRQAEDFLGRLAEQVRGASGTLRILEMGAGTGGTTRWLLPVLARAGMPVEYTFTDLAPSLVAAARKRFTAEYPFMRFQAHDIEKEPLEQLIGTQHVVVASNAVHATHNLRTSLANMRKALRPDGLLLLVEMTGRVWWMDLVFGLFEGWWFFDDSRSYVISDERAWEADLRAVGYGCVAWTDGARPENKMERLIVATASDNPLTKCAGFSSSSSPPPRLSFPCLSASSPSSVAASNGKSLPAADCDARQAVVDRYVRDLTDGFSASMDDAIARQFGTKSKLRLFGPEGACVLVTGATGSLGSHLVAELALRPGVRRVVCLNRARRGRHGDEDPWERQRQAFAMKAIVLPDHAAAKLTVLETDLSKPRLGLAGEQYDALVGDATHIVHNAWLMNTKWPLVWFEPQLRIMRCMIDLARDVAACRPQDGEGTAAATFQFVSSIAAVGHWPLHTGRPTVPEERMAPDSALPIGYGVAKHICERMLDETLHHPRHAAQFRAMVVRLGQIAGSCRTGYWNPAEHLPFLVRSSQTLGAMPALDGHLSWTPIDAVAATLADLLLRPGRAHPVYHIDNPIRQPWPDMVRLLADSLGMQSLSEAVIPFTDWLRRLRDHPARGKAGENPAALLADFFDRDFVHMSCGALVLGTAKACNHSPTLANLGAVTDETVKLFVKRWRDTGFLD